MDWSRWWIGPSELDQICRFCQTIIRLGDVVVIEEAWPDPECIHCHLERLRALTKKAKPKNKPKPKGAVMPWKPLGAAKGNGGKAFGTPISKWASGTILEGKYVEIRQGKFGPIFEFNDEKLGTVVYPVPARLGFMLEKASSGDRLRIECLGKIPGQNMNQLWDFNVSRDEPA